MIHRSEDSCKDSPVPMAATVIPSIAIAITVLVVLRKRFMSGALMHVYVCTHVA